MIESIYYGLVCYILDLFCIYLLRIKEKERNSECFIIVNVFMIKFRLYGYIFITFTPL